MMSSEDAWIVQIQTSDTRMVKAVPPLEHNDSILSYGTEDLAQYRDLPQATTRIVLGCAGAATTNPYIDTTAGYQVGVFL